MKKLNKNISPFLLLSIPFFIVLVLLAVQSGSELIQEREQLTASFFKLPQFNVFQVFFRQ